MTEEKLNEFCAMMLAKDNYAHNIPKEWINEKVWAVLLKNPVYKDYVKKYSNYVNNNVRSTHIVNKKLHKKVKKDIDNFFE